MKTQTKAKIAQILLTIVFIILMIVMLANVKK
jgi:uncharacterized membrane protein YtjA (UPF0391 family)